MVKNKNRILKVNEYFVRMYEKF